MKKSELRKFYLTFARLYGVIGSEDSYEIIKRFYPDLKKETYLNDLKSRVGKETHDYIVRETDVDGEYIIQNEYVDDDFIDYIFEQMIGKDYFVLNNIDDYLNIGEKGIDPHESYYKLIDSIKKRGFDKSEAIVTCGLLYEKIRHSEDANEVIKIFLDIMEIEDIDDANDLIQDYIQFQNNVRLFTNGGYTPSELAKKRGPINIDDISLDIGKNFTDSLINGEIDPQYLLDEIINDKNIPIMMKDSLIKQLQNIIDIRNNKAKA